jgi:hypothetical protein
MLRFRILTAVVMKSYIFWDIKPCSPLQYNRRFGGTCHLLLQSVRINRGRINQHETDGKQRFNDGFLLGLFSDTEGGDEMFLQNVG